MIISKSCPDKSLSLPSILNHRWETYHAERNTERQLFFFNKELLIFLSKGIQISILYYQTDMHVNLVIFKG